MKSNRLVLKCLIIKGQTRETRITWFKDGRRIESMRQLKLVGPHKGILRVASAQPEHKAAYKCEASNGFSKDSLVFKVRVLGESCFIYIFANYI